MKTWNIDKNHSEIGFSVKHLMVSTVKGTFDDFRGSVNASDDSFSDLSASFEASVSSVNTKNEMRDNHLKSADFFDAENFPTLSFVSKSFTKKDGNEFTMTGDLTMRGVPKEVTLNVVFNGVSKSPIDGIRVAGFEVTGTINRSDFGLVWNAPVETGGVVVSDEVKLTIEVEAKEA